MAVRQRNGLAGHTLRRAQGSRPLSPSLGSRLAHWSTLTSCGGAHSWPACARAAGSARAAAPTGSATRRRGGDREADAHLLLSADVTDDGVGGASPDRGSGLAGLARRLDALDGRMEVVSPAGGRRSSPWRSSARCHRRGQRPPPRRTDLSARGQRLRGRGRSRSRRRLGRRTPRDRCRRRRGRRANAPDVHRRRSAGGDRDSRCPPRLPGTRALAIRRAAGRPRAAEQRRRGRRLPAERPGRRRRRVRRRRA